jgi:DNA polymerase-1
MTKHKQDLKQILELILEIRGLEKLLSTYYEGIEDLIYPDGCVRTQYQHVDTGTGRLSSKRPNIQNVPAEQKIIKEHFTSRYGTGEMPWEEGGVLIGADYKSLEVRVEAQLSGDLQYITDVQNNVCFHTKHLALKKRVEYALAAEKVETGEWKDERRRVKAFTFGLQYGAGNKTVSKNSGMSEEEVEDLRKERVREYPRLHLYYDWLLDTVNKQGYYIDPFGVKYCFKKYPPRFKWQKEDQYSPTEIQNYRTQGTASTINLIMLGIFWRTKGILNRHKYVMVNTIHDNLILDCKKDYIEDAKKDIKILEEIKPICDNFNFSLKVSFPVEINYGKNWADC